MFLRTLIVVPILHGECDMGSLHEQVRQDYVTRYGHQKWLDHFRSIDQVWNGIQQMIAALELPLKDARLYQDGLPVCGNEGDIVRDVAAQGSRNHQILLDLMAQGAVLMGTENPDLLLEEYRLHVSGPRDDENMYEVKSRELLIARDRFIAARINSTLIEGEIGLLFVGMAHRVEALLDGNILVRHLLPSLREKQKEIQ